MSEVQASQSIEIRPLRVQDAPAFAALQRRVFPEYNSTKLGQGFCTALYRAYAARPDAYGFGAWRGNDLLGLLIACHRDVEADIQRSLRGRALLAAFGRPHLLVSRATLARGIRFLYRRREHDAAVALRPGEAPIDATCIRFVTMGVAPEARRLGLARRLAEASEAEALRRGFLFAEGNVYITNDATRRHWEKLGWVAGAEPPGGRGSIRYSVDLRRVAAVRAAAHDQGKGS